VVVEDLPGSDHSRRYILVDRSANVLTRVPGPLVAISERFAIFHTSDDRSFSYVVVP